MHVSEASGGSGFGLEELVVVVEEMGRAVAPGPFVPTVIASAFLDAAADDTTKAALLPGLVDGSVRAAIAVDSDLALGADATVTGRAEAVLGGGMAQLLVVPAGDDVALDDVAASEKTGTELKEPTAQEDVPAQEASAEAEGIESPKELT